MKKTLTLLTTALLGFGILTVQAQPGGHLSELRIVVEREEDRALVEAIVERRPG